MPAARLGQHSHGPAGDLPARAEHQHLGHRGCSWVITEDVVAGYDGAEPSTVGKSGPDQAVAEDVAEALAAGRFFRLVEGNGCELAIGRLYDPSGENELAPLDAFGRQNLGALNIEFRAEGDWQAA